MVGEDTCYINRYVNLILHVLLLACYIPNVAKRVYEISVRSMNIDDQPTTDLALISNGRISATGDPIHFMCVRPLYFALRHYTSLLTHNDGRLETFRKVLASLSAL